MFDTLANRYRPQTLDDVVEQDVIKKTLKRQIERGTFQRAILFCGPAGCGKTTNARIFAKEINGGNNSYIEINAAVRNRVEDIRDLVEDAQFVPIGSTYKVYIVDECHMLTVQAWNAFLKLLEETPKHVVFILCTTDPQKIIDTVLSRTQRYEFKRISFKGIVNRLQEILNNEKSGENISGVATWDIEALEYIAKLSKGGMRSALTLLDKCLAYSPDVTVSNVINVIGVAGWDDMFDLLTAVKNKDDKSCLEIINKLYQSSVDLKQFVKDFISFVVDISKFCQTKNFELLDYLPNNYQGKIASFSDIVFLRAVLNQLLKLSTSLKWESNPKLLIEATFITEICGVS